MSSFPAALAIILAVVIPIELVRAYRQDGKRVERWARAHGVALTDETRPVLARYLRNARVYRTWGGVAGAVLPSLIEYAATGRVQVLGFGTDGTSAPLGFGTIFVGYLVGGLAAEVALVRPVNRARRAASLTRRELTDYLPRRVVLAQRGLAAAGSAGILGIGVAPFADGVSNPGPAGLAIGAALVLASAAGLEWIERWIVRRPQPYTSEPLIAADDAMRAQSIRAVAGAGLALLLLLCSGVALALQGSESSLLRATMVVPAGVCLILSLLAARDVGDGAWRVQRSAKPAGPASA
jgi:hypothetical protein